MEGEVQPEANKVESVSPVSENISSDNNLTSVSLTDKLRENPWILSTLVLGILALMLLVGNFSGGMTGNAVAGSDAGSSIVDYLNAQTGGGVEFVSSEDLGDLYKVLVLYNGQEIPVYVTKDGKYYVQGVVSMDEVEPAQQRPVNQQQASSDVVKSDNPIVDLFIMTHCPYGTQAEKGIIPAIRTLGESVDAKIRFVHYFMHGDEEEQETYNQVCIREEQSDKFLDYLECFLEDSDSARCMKEVGINGAQLKLCLDNGKAQEYYAEDSELSNQYGVKGSPTLIVNGAQSGAGRDSDSYLNGMCDAFTEAPSECSEELSSAAPSPGFGYSASGGGNSAAQCS